MKKFLVSIFCFFVFALLSSTGTFAHVVVNPDQAKVGEFQTFSVDVPNEKDNPTVKVRLLIPDGLEHVTPNVKPGWDIDVKTSNSAGDEEEKITEIVWSDGSIPQGRRDSFLFSARVPSDEADIIWKAYQTYQDGSVVKWDQEPNENLTDDEKEEQEEKGLGPYSTTSVIDDLANGERENNLKPDNITTFVAYAALALSIASLGFALRKGTK